jgi:hypothetical protein
MLETVCSTCNELTVPGKNFCPNCGASLLSTPQLEARILEIINARFEDQEFLTLKTSADVATRLTDWLKAFLVWAGIPLALIAIILTILGVSNFTSFKARINEAEARVEAATGEASAKAVLAGKRADELSGSVGSSENKLQRLEVLADRTQQQYEGILSQTAKYSDVNKRIEELQKQLIEVQGVINLGDKTVRARTFETTGDAGPSSLMFSRTGCGPSSLDTGKKIALCVRDFPSQPFVFWYQRTSSGDERPVASISPEGFQDVSLGQRPSCGASKRGTIFVQKGSSHQADEVYLCLRDANDAYAWSKLTYLPSAP